MNSNILLKADETILIQVKPEKLGSLFIFIGNILFFSVLSGILFSGSRTEISAHEYFLLSVFILILSFIVTLYSSLCLANTNYFVTNYRCIVSINFLGSSTNTLFYDKVTDINISSNPFYRLVNLSKITLLYQGSSQRNTFIFRYLNQTTANEIFKLVCDKCHK